MGRLEGVLTIGQYTAAACTVGLGGVIGGRCSNVPASYRAPVWGNAFAINLDKF